MNGREPSPSANSSSKPQASVSDSRASSCWMRSSIEICSGGSTMRGRRFARSSTPRNAASRLNRSTSSSGSYVSPAASATLRVRPHELRAAQRLALVQQLGRRLELLVLEQPPHQRLARILFRLAVLLRRIGPRQQHPRLDVDERRRHDQELAGHVEVQLLHQLDVGEVLLRDERIGMS